MSKNTYQSLIKTTKDMCKQVKKNAGYKVDFLEMKEHCFRVYRQELKIC